MIILEQKKGIILLTSMFLVLLISVLGVGYLALVNNQLEMAGIALKSTKAFYCAETGVSEAMIRFRTGVFTGFSGTTIDNGEYNVEPVSEETDKITIKSTGRMSGFQRIVQVTLDKTIVPGRIIQQNWEEI